MCIGRLGNAVANFINSGIRLREMFSLDMVYNFKKLGLVTLFVYVLRGVAVCWGGGVRYFRDLLVATKN